MNRLIGQVFNKVDEYNNEIRFYQGDNIIYSLHHEQDCCESVVIEDIVGNLKDLENTTILDAREDYADASDSNKCYEGDSATWSFYNIRTVKGSVTIRFFGTSNGYYSESAGLYEMC